MSSGFIKTADGTEIFYKDWGSKSGQPIVFHHGWPLSSDDWDAQMLFFLQSGYRVVAHDRRGHGRSSQVDSGNDMNHYAADASAVVEHLNLRNAVHIGHSTGGGEVARCASLLQIKLLKNGVLKIYPGYPHGMLTTNADIINPDLLAFIKG